MVVLSKSEDPKLHRVLLSQRQYFPLNRKLCRPPCNGVLTDLLEKVRSKHFEF